MIQTDSLKVMLEVTKPISDNTDFTPYIIIIISGIFSLIVAYVTSKLTRKNELEKIKAEQKNLTDKINYDLKQMLLSIESEHLKKIFDTKLEAFKAIKNIQFAVFENNIEVTDEILVYMKSFQYSTIISNFYDLIIEYSHIFNENIMNQIKDIYYDTTYTKNNFDPDCSSWNEFPVRIKKKYDILVDLVMNDLKINFQSVEEKIIK